jgi:quercetin dioxygenase-like cupin family protein
MKPLEEENMLMRQLKNGGYRRLSAFICGGSLAFALALPAIAQTPAPAIKRTILQKTDVGGNQETILGLAEIAPGGSTGKHSHPGIETGYVLEGTAILVMEGMPPIAMNAGTSYLIPAGKVHDAKNTGSVPVKVLATYVVEKGKPLATAAP